MGQHLQGAFTKALEKQYIKEACSSSWLAAASYAQLNT